MTPGGGANFVKIYGLTDERRQKSDHKSSPCHFVTGELKRHKPFSSYGDTSLQAKTLPRISKTKKGHNYAHKKQIRVMGLVPIMLDKRREQNKLVCKVSIAEKGA
jgi:hypothetical protein